MYPVKCQHCDIILLHRREKYKHNKKFHTMLSLQKPAPYGFASRPQKVLMSHAKSIEDKLEESIVEVG
jgi:hypothetical protein